MMYTSNVTQSDIVNRQNGEEKQATLENLQDMFRGSLEPSVVGLILSESNNNVNDAVEKLITLASSTPLIQKDRYNTSNSDIVSQECFDGPYVSDDSFRSDCPTKSYSSLVDIGLSTAENPQKLFDGPNLKGCVKDQVVSVGKRLAYSADNLVSSCTGPPDIPKQSESTTEEPELSEPFKQFMRNFTLANSNTSDWHSTKSNNFTEYSQQEHAIKQEEEITPNHLNNSSMNRNNTNLNISTTLPSWPDVNQPNSIFHNKPQNTGPTSPIIVQQPIMNHPRNNMFIPNNGGPTYHQFRPRQVYFNGQFANQAFQIRGMHQQRPRFIARNHGQHMQGRIPTRFNMSHSYKPQNQSFNLPNEKVLVLLRGLPGSGKSTLAMRLKGNGVVFSTDEFFMLNGRYQFQVHKLGEAHEWNQLRAREAMQKGITPVIIDNTNTEIWQMRPYVSMAQRLGYKIVLKEPDTYWKWNPKELVKRNRHGVSLSQIKSLMDRYEHNLTIDMILPKGPTNTDHKDVVTSDNIANPLSEHQSVNEEKPNVKNTRQEGQITGRGNKNFDRSPGKKPISRRDVPNNDKRQYQQRGPRNLLRKQDDQLYRSHGSRSPVEEFAHYMQSEGEAEQNCIQQESRNSNGENTTSPKPQRVARKRERRSSEKIQAPESELDIDTIEKEATGGNDIDISDGQISEVVYADEAEEEYSFQSNDKPCTHRLSETSKEMRISDEQKLFLPKSTQEEMDVIESSSQLSACSINDNTSTDDNSDDVIVESEEDFDNTSRQSTADSESNITVDSGLSLEEPMNEANDPENDAGSEVMTGIEFLDTCFPDMNDQELAQILSDCGGNVTKAIEIILNSIDLADPINDNCSSGSESSKEDYPISPKRNDGSTASSSQGSFQMAIEPAVAFHLFELFGPIECVASKGEFTDNDLSIDVDKEFSRLLYQQWKKSIQKRKGISSSTKQTTSPAKSPRKKSHRKHLVLQDPIPPPSKFKAKPADLREIMDEQLAMEQSRSEQDKRESDTNLAVVLKRQKLYAMFPGVDPTALEELFEANRFELQPTVDMVQASCNIQAQPTFLIQEESSNESDGYNYAEIPEDKQGYQELDHPGYQDFRGEAQTHYKQREECFKKAALAFAQKKGQLAQFYASQGHLHSEKIKEANDRAAARILEHKNADKSPNALDLHGLHVTEALKALQEKLNPPEGMYRPRYINVVTGRGLHSRQGRAKIKPAVLDFLQRHNYRYEEKHAGQLKVFLNKSKQ